MEQQFLSIQRQRLLRRIERYSTISRGSEGQDGFIPEFRSLKVDVILPKVRNALTRLERGLYGICVTCEGEISRARLEVVPAALECIVCQSKSEGGALCI